jgi:hypothetical protein
MYAKGLLGEYGSTRIGEESIVVLGASDNLLSVREAQAASMETVASYAINLTGGASPAM